MAKSHEEKRYQVGYNKPVQGTIGNSPRRFHFIMATDDPLDAIVEVDNLRKNSGDIWGRKAFIVDTKHGTTATIVTGPGAYCRQDLSPTWTAKMPTRRRRVRGI